MPPPANAQVTIDLSPGKYQNSLSSYRMLLETKPGPFLYIALQTPAGVLVGLQVRTSDSYIIGFHGASKWWGFDGEEGAWGTPVGTGCNYNNLGKVGDITLADLTAIGKLASFAKGIELEKRLVAICIAITSEAARFATVATYFTGLVNSVLPTASVDFEMLKNRYFLHWDKPGDQRFVGGEILLKK
ncbi:MAG: ribosome-inactivating family protein [Bryobacteraceae bacterium]|nr:ribosome-inactivating family protein [Bryobacteraceae bacterium]